MRGKVWKLLLRVTQLPASTYIQLVELGPSFLDEKIRQDTFRTMTTDTNFLEHVSEDMLVRILNAFVWTSDGNKRTLLFPLSTKSLLDIDNKQSITKKYLNTVTTTSVTYVQGMNVLAAPFLMTMPEMEAFFCFSTFIWKWCPLYVQPTMKGVHCGLRLLDLCLCSLDPTLYGYLRGKNLSASTYAFARKTHTHFINACRI